MDETRADEIDVAGLHLDGVDELGEDVALFQAAVGVRFQSGEVDLVLKAEIETGVLAALCQHQPRLRLAVGAREVLLGEGGGGVHLHGEADGAVQIFDQTVISQPAQRLVGAQSEQVVEEDVRPFHHRDAVPFAEIDGIDGFHLARQPLFGEGVVPRVVAHEGTEPLSADVVAEDTVALEEYGRVHDAVKRRGVGHGDLVLGHLRASASFLVGMDGAPPFLDITHAHARAANSAASSMPSMVSVALPSRMCAMMLPI